MPFCGSCGAQVADSVTFCSSCGKPVAAAGGTPTGAAAAGTAPAASPVQPGALPMAENIAGLLAYITIIPAIVFLVLEPYNKNRFVRFHSFQNIGFHIAWIALWVGLTVIANIPVLGFMTLFIWPLVGLAGFVIWLVLLLKAYQGQMFKLPGIGPWAEKQANVVTPTAVGGAKAA